MCSKHEFCIKKIMFVGKDMEEEREETGLQLRWGAKSTHSISARKAQGFFFSGEHIMTYAWTADIVTFAVTGKSINLHELGHE